MEPSYLLLWLVSLICIDEIRGQTFQSFGLSEYFVGRNSIRGYVRAEKECTKINASLAIVDNREINDFLVQEIGILTDEPYSFFIGLRRIDNSNNNLFAWVDGSLLGNFSNWAVGEPTINVFNSPKTSEFCVTMGSQSTLDPQFQWRDVLCNNWESNYICERPAGFQTAVVADIIFVLDDYIGLPLQHFYRRRDWIKNLLRNFSGFAGALTIVKINPLRVDIANGNLRVGFILFSSRSRTPIALSKHESFSLFVREINSIIPRGGVPRIGRAIRAATEEFQTRGRNDTTQLMILFSERSSDDNEAVYSQRARDVGINILAVGVGDNYQYNQLVDITGSESNVFEVTDYNNFDSIADQFLNEIEAIVSGAVTTISSSTVSTTSATLLPPFERFGLDEYYIELNSDVRSYVEAETRCGRRQASLAIVNTQALQNFLVQQIGSVSAEPYSFLIGLRRIDNSNSNLFAWDDGTPLMSGFSNWAVGEPEINVYDSPKTSEFCVTMGARLSLDSQYQWRDVLCNNWVTHFICQRPLEPGPLIRADIIFALEYTLGRGEFLNQLNRIIDLLRNFKVDITRGDLRVGVLAYERRAKSEIMLNENMTFSQLAARIKRISYALNIGSNTGNAIGLATDQFVSQGRNNITKILFVLPEGGSDDNVTGYSRRARELGINVIFLGLGSTYNPNQLVSITGNVSRVYEESSVERTRTETIENETPQTPTFFTLNPPPPFPTMEPSVASSAVDLSGRRFSTKFLNVTTPNLSILESTAKSSLIASTTVTKMRTSTVYLSKQPSTYPSAVTKSKFLSNFTTAKTVQPAILESTATPKVSTASYSSTSTSKTSSAFSMLTTSPTSYKPVAFSAASTPNSLTSFSTSQKTTKPSPSSTISALKPSFKPTTNELPAVPTLVYPISSSSTKSTALATRFLTTSSATATSVTFTSSGSSATTQSSNLQRTKPSNNNFTTIGVSAVSIQSIYTAPATEFSTISQSTSSAMKASTKPNSTSSVSTTESTLKLDSLTLSSNSATSNSSTTAQTLSPLFNLTTSSSSLVTTSMKLTPPTPSSALENPGSTTTTSHAATISKSFATLFSTVILCYFAAYAFI